MTRSNGAARSVVISRAPVVAQPVGEELAGGDDVASFRDVHVDDLAVLVVSPVYVAPDAADFDVGLVNEPPVTCRVAAGPDRFDEHSGRGEALYPPVDGDVVDFDAAFGEEFFDVAVGQAVAEVPAHGQQDYLGREPVAGKRIGLNGARMIHPDTPAVGRPIRQRNGAARTPGDVVDQITSRQALRRQTTPGTVVTVERGPRPKNAAVSGRMARQGTSDTKPEMALRRELHRRGLRFRVNRRNLPGTPDIVFGPSRVVVFVDGCFWHDCPDHGVLPKNNREWWREKLDATRDRDTRKDADLAALGWRVKHVWEHESPRTAADEIERLVSAGRSPWTRRPTSGHRLQPRQANEGRCLK